MRCGFNLKFITLYVLMIISIKRMSIQASVFSVAYFLLYRGIALQFGREELKKVDKTVQFFIDIKQFI